MIRVPSTAAYYAMYILKDKGYKLNIRFKDGTDE